MTVADLAISSTAPTKLTGQGAKPYLFSPFVDFMLLGGASLIVLPLVHFLPYHLRPALAVFVFQLAFFVNYPHLLGSYQVFYRDFFSQAFNPATKQSLRWRYIFAGIIVPLLLAGFFTMAMMQPTPRILGLGGNLLILLVGWHYAKQGYGILIVDSVLKRRFFSKLEKRILLYNTHACWILFWVFSNWFVNFHLRQYRGISYFAFLVPEICLWIAGGAACITTLASLIVLGRRLAIDRHSLPINGVTAYLVTLYVWLSGLFDPTMLLVVPALHAIQYHVVVGRYEINRASSKTNSAWGHYTSVVGFFGLAVLLSFLAFKWAPMDIGRTVNYSRLIFGGTAFFFIFGIFINIHHFFMDNVVWRGDNPGTAAHLFGTKK